jgi:hypothetical protein
LEDWAHDYHCKTNGEEDCGCLMIIFVYKLSIRIDFLVSVS